MQDSGQFQHQSDMQPTKLLHPGQLLLDQSNLSEMRFNIPVNNFSVMLGLSQHFLSINQYCRDLMCFAQGHNTSKGWNPGPIHSESDAL